MTTGDRLGQPRSICDLCYANQTFHPADQGRDVYYCDHNGVLAIPKADCSGYIFESGIDRSEWRRRAEAAATTLKVLTAQAKKMN